jgi:hypothetical protein
MSAPIQEDSNLESLPIVLPSEDSKATRLFKLMNRLAADEMRRYKREQILYFPFFITDSQLEELAKDIIKALGSVPTLEGIDFVGTVLFDDLSSQRFDDFEQFLDRAGKRKDPLGIKLSWNKYAIDSNGEVISGQIELSFTTEKRLKTGRSNQDSIPRSKIEVIVSGSDQRWVDQLFDDMVPMVKTTAHGGMMRPLWIFQNTSVVSSISAVLAVTTIVYILNFAQKRNLLDNQEEQVRVLKLIKNSKDIGYQLSHYVTWALTPKPFPIAEFIIAIVLVFFVGASIFATAEKLLPLLTPSSAVAIGTAKRRALSGIDVFKFIFFTLILGAVVIPLVKAGIAFIWGMITK